MEKINDIIGLIKAEWFPWYDLKVVRASPAKGILYVTTNSPHFISGQVRLRGRNHGSYPFNYLEMIDNLFGKEENIIEVCSGRVQSQGCFTVDINPALVDDGQELSRVADSQFNRLRCDPPYNSHTAQSMYGTSLPDTLVEGRCTSPQGRLINVLVVGTTNSSNVSSWSAMDRLGSHKYSS